MRKYVYFGLISGLVVLLDQVTKLLVLNYIPLYRKIPVIPGFFNLTHLTNPGGAFGFLARTNSPLKHWLFIGASLAALLMIIYFYQQTPKSHRWLGAALAMIFGGAIGNLIDRFRFGEVVDFLDVYVGNMHWPAFNVADSGVTVGVIILIFHLLFKKAPF